MGGKRLVQKARQSGAPIDGVVVSAGIPDLEEAVELIDELNSVGITHVVFKPGTVEQIRSVIRIAAEVPTKPVIAHIEGGRAGGHHSWEDLDDLLLATYSELRVTANITVCVGGGIGTPERASEYLSGRWAEGHGFPLMPVDGILVGTAAMATLEATTSPQVKQMLVDTKGTDQWVGAGKAQGGMASSRSQLGADIHEIDNTASRCGRLLDEVAGDAEAVAERRDEIIAAMANTAKPYFGDVAEMTYRSGCRATWSWPSAKAIQHRRHRIVGQSLAGRHVARPIRADAQTRRGAFGIQVISVRSRRCYVNDAASPAGAAGRRDRRAAGPLSRGRRDPICIPPTFRGSSSCARHWASPSTSCPSSTRMSGVGGAAIRCGRPMTRGTRPTRSASSPAPRRSQASRGSTSPSVSCSTDSSRPPSIRCWLPVQHR